MTEQLSHRREDGLKRDDPTVFASMDIRRLQNWRVSYRDRSPRQKHTNWFIENALDYAERYKSSGDMSEADKHLRIALGAYVNGLSVRKVNVESLKLYLQTAPVSQEQLLRTYQMFQLAEYIRAASASYDSTPTPEGGHDTVIITQESGEESSFGLGREHILGMARSAIRFATASGDGTSMLTIEMYADGESSKVLPVSGSEYKIEKGRIYVRQTTPPIAGFRTTKEK